MVHRVDGREFQRSDQGPAHACCVFDTAVYILGLLHTEYCGRDSHSKWYVSWICYCCNGFVLSGVLHAATVCFPEVHSPLLPRHHVSHLNVSLYHAPSAVVQGCLHHF
jgi:hypothetical protein